jgi:energy-coupling factor transporter ATP-binding protein EcfA2
VTLALRGVRYRYAGAAAAALEGVSLTLEPGRVLGVVGPNGAGKSTLCLVAAGLAPATIGGELAGEVRIDGMTTASSRPHELAQRCGILFQNPTTQLSGTSATVWEEVAFGPRNLGLPLEEVVARVDAALDALTIRPLADRDPERLSGGQAQLVALAGVLALRPAYLVLDEPTSQLDPRGTRLVGAAIGELTRHTGAGVLIVEHKTDLLATIADQVAVLVAGSVVASDEAASILADARLEAWGIEPPSRIRIERAARRAGVHLASEVEA